MHANPKAIREDVLNNLNILKPRIEAVSSITLEELCRIVGAKIHPISREGYVEAEVVLPAEVSVVVKNPDTGLESKGFVGGIRPNPRGETWEEALRAVAQQLSNRTFVFFSRTRYRQELKVPTVTLDADPAQASL
jgi:hypothetical protein